MCNVEVLMEVVHAGTPESWSRVALILVFPHGPPPAARQRLPGINIGRKVPLNSNLLLVRGLSNRD